MKILVVQDGHRLAKSTQKQLAASFVIDVAADAQAALAKTQAIEYGVVILDLNQQGSANMHACDTLRKAKLKVPLLVLFTKAEVDIKVGMLRCGADDCLVRPFHPEELHARVLALARRGNHYSPVYTLTAGDLIIDVSKRRVERAGTAIQLSRKEFDVLEYLVSNKGRVLSRDMILEHAWDEGKDRWHNTVDVHIKHLRDKIDKPFSEPIIKTAYGLGYLVDD